MSKNLKNFLHTIQVLFDFYFQVPNKNIEPKEVVLVYNIEYLNEMKKELDKTIERK